MRNCGVCVPNGGHLVKTTNFLLLFAKSFLLIQKKFKLEMGHIFLTFLNKMLIFFEVSTVGAKLCVNFFHLQMLNDKEYEPSIKNNMWQTSE